MKHATPAGTTANHGPQSGTLYWLPRILADRTFDATSTLLMVGLADHVNADDECFVGIQRLADYARCSYGTARRKLAALEQLGAIDRTLRHREDGGQSVYDYRLVRLDPPAQSDQGGSAQNEQAPPRTTRAGPPAHQGARAEPPLVEPPRRNDPPAAAAAEDLFGDSVPDVKKALQDQAHALTTRVFERTGPKPAEKFVAVLAVVKALLRAEHDPERIVAAMSKQGPISIKAIEFRMMQDRPPTTRSNIDERRDQPSGPISFRGDGTVERSA